MLHGNSWICAQDERHDAPDMDMMNRHVARMVEEALKYKQGWACLK